MNRRNFLRLLGVGALSTVLPATGLAQSSVERPPQLNTGDTVELVGPAVPIYEPWEIQIMAESMNALGLEVKMGRYVMERNGYLAGEDQKRATARRPGITLREGFVE